jgi:hypothetical protein
MDEARLPNGLEMSRPPTQAYLPSLYASLAGKTSVHFAQLGGSAPASCWAARGEVAPRGGPWVYCSVEFVPAGLARPLR